MITYILRTDGKLSKIIGLYDNLHTRTWKSTVAIDEIGLSCHHGCHATNEALGEELFVPKE